MRIHPSKKSGRRKLHYRMLPECWRQRRNSALSINPDHNKASHPSLGRAKKLTAGKSRGWVVLVRSSGSTAQDAEQLSTNEDRNG